jgi:hypothetical protein
MSPLGHVWTAPWQELSEVSQHNTIRRFESPAAPSAGLLPLFGKVVGLDAGTSGPQLNFIQEAAEFHARVRRYRRAGWMSASRPRMT